MMHVNLGIQSYCFRNLRDRETVARNVRALGLDRLEICELHGDFNDLGSWKETVAFYRDQGITIDSIGVQTFTGDPAQERWFEAAAATGVRHISTHFQVDTFRQAVPQCREWCERHEVRLGLHPHGGYMFGGQPDVIRHLLEIGGPSIGLNLDTAWVLQIGPRGGDPVAWIEEFRQRIFALHLKDFTFQPSGQWTEHITGEGNLDLPRLLHALAEENFHGTAYIEYEAETEDPMPALDQCVQAARARLDELS